MLILQKDRKFITNIQSAHYKTNNKRANYNHTLAHVLNNSIRQE